ncbi:MAG: hypothetical protein J5643_11750 [Lachnospiraceae bacterium]|nr:hypothetical protein [Lachnospiraceae bacterium]
MNKVFFRENPDNEIIVEKPKWTAKKTVFAILAVILAAVGIYGAVIIVKVVVELSRFKPAGPLHKEREVILDNGSRRVREWITANDPTVSLQNETLEVYEPYASKKTIWNVLKGEMKKDGRTVKFMFVLDTGEMLIDETPETFRPMLYENLCESFLPGTPDEYVIFENWMPTCLYYKVNLTSYTLFRGEGVPEKQDVEIARMMPALMDKDKLDGFLAGRNYGFRLDGTIVLTSVDSLEEDLMLLCDESERVSPPTISLRWLYDTGVEAKIELYNEERTERWIIRKILGKDEYHHTIEIEMWRAASVQSPDNISYAKLGTRTYELDRNGDMKLKLISEDQE